MTTTWSVQCAYCRQQCTGPHAWIESRPHKVVKRDGTVIAGASEFHVCDSCHQRLPVDR